MNTKKGVEKPNWRQIFLLVSIVTIGLVSWKVYASWPTKNLQLSGIILDATTQQPVPKAKVIITTRNTILWGDGPWIFGILADEGGEFGIEKNMKYRFNHIHLEICSPENRYTYYQSIKNKRNQSFFVGGPKQKGQTKPTYQEYSRFSGGAWSKNVGFLPYSAE